MKKKQLWAMLLLIAILAFGCGGNAQNDDMAAQANGVVITTEDVEQQIAYIAAMSQIEVTDEIHALFYDYALDQLIYAQLVSDDAEARNITITTEDAKAELTALVEQYYGSLDEYIDTYFKMYGISLEDVVNKYHIECLYQAITAQVLSETLIDPKAIYNEDPSKYYQQEQISISHILLETEEEANDVLAMLNDGRDFGELAVEFSIDGSAVYNEGALGYYNRDGYAIQNSMVDTSSKLIDEFIEEAFRIEVGTYSSKPLHTQFGYHIILVDDKVDAYQMSFEEAEDLIVQNAESELLAQWKQSLYDNAEIEYAQKAE